MAKASKLFGALPRGVWTLGFVSLFMDLSSEMIHALLPLYLVTVLGTSALTVGFIEGVAEATASITKIFSGGLSDWLGRRKLLAAIGYGLAAFTKPVFPLATTVGWLVAARFVDRIGKGIRGAPRDALVADLAPDELRGAAFGLRQSLDTVGAFLGPLLAIGLMAVGGDDFRLVFWIAVIPAIISFALIAFGVDEPEPTAVSPKATWRLSGSLALGGPFWWLTGFAALLTLARFSEAFLILRAQSLAMPTALIPSVMVAMSLVYSLAAYPAGILSDRLGRFGMVAIGAAFLIAADVALALAPDIAWLMGGVALWGLHMGFTQGLLASLVADSAQPHLRGTAFGVFNFISGLAMLAASVIAGALWDRSGPAQTFLAGAAFTGGALLLLVAIRRKLPGQVSAAS